MIAAKRATRESRPRDAGRGRVLLAIGKETYHLTVEEARKLARELEKVTRPGRAKRCAKH